MSDEQPENKSPVSVKETRHGRMMYLNNDEYIGRSLDLYGEFSELEWNLFSQIIKPDMTVIDVGANIGAHTIPMAKAVGAGGHVLAFEPQRMIFNMLCGNIALNALINVKPFMNAVGNEPGVTDVPIMNINKINNFGGVSLTACPKSVSCEPVPVVTIDNFALAKCHFLKIDVEGMEQSVIEGATQLLKRCCPIIYVENDRVNKSEPLIRTILNKGYRLYWHAPPLFNPNNFLARSEDVFPRLVSLNMIGIPQNNHSFSITNGHEITHENAHYHPMHDQLPQN